MVDGLMANPAATTILTEIVSRMSNITTVNGYNTTVKKIELGKLEPFVGYDLPAVNVWPTNMLNTPLAYDQEQRSMSVMIEIHDLTRDDPFSTVVERLAADVVTAINRKTTLPAVSDISSNNLADTVTDLVFDGYDYQIGNGQKPFCGALVRFTVKYITDKNSMTTYGD
jgi:hypothetical protein